MADAYENNEIVDLYFLHDTHYVSNSQCSTCATRDMNEANEALYEIKSKVDMSHAGWSKNIINKILWGK